VSAFTPPSPEQHKRLFVPGPVEVDPEVLAEMARPVISHRGKDFQALYRALVPGIQWIFQTKGLVLVSTSSATGLWEAASRCAVRRRCLHLVNGAFSERWEDVTRRCGRETGVLAAEWGRAHRPDDVERELRTGRYDAVALCHSETSTGVLDPLAEIAGVVRRFDDVLLLVDAVSSLSTVPIDVDRLGIDLCLAGVQKGLALPPGISICSVGERARARCRSIPVAERGYYFDLETLEEFGAKGETPSTPSISHLYALLRQVERMRTEGLEARYARHRRLADRCRLWAAERGFRLFPEPGFEAIGLTCLENARRIDLGALEAGLAARGAQISDGYGQLKGRTFRIAHMGDTQPAELERLLGWIDELTP